MAPMTMTPSLQGLLKLDKDFKGWGDQQLQQAADIAGIPLDVGLDVSQIQKLASRNAAHGRAERVLHSLLGQLKTEEGRQKSRGSALTFVLLRRLLLFVPASTSARLFNSNDVMDIIKNYLEEIAAEIEEDLDESNQTMDSGSSVTLEDSQPISKKRKRTKHDTDGNGESKKTSMKIAKNEQGNLSSLGLFINEIIQLSDSSNEILDAISTQHLKSVIRTSTTEAADILSAWLRCVLKLWQCGGDFDSEAIMRTHFAIAQIWYSRSLEIDDESGSSASTFSKTCLVPAVSLYARISHVGLLDGRPSSLSEMNPSLEQLLARHVFIPGRASFAATSDKKKAKQPDGPDALTNFLQPLQAEIVRLASDDKHDSLRPLVYVLPSLLEQAIKLCPRSSPKQKLADASWIESVVEALSFCAGEPIPFEPSGLPKPDAALSPLQSMLQLVQKSQITLGPQFLESLLLGYSGLDGIKARKDVAVRWDLVTVLLELGGSVFLKEKPKDKEILAEDDFTNRIPPYVEALVGTIESTKWGSPIHSRIDAVSDAAQSISEVLTWSNSVEDAVAKVLVPLMRAYISARNLNGFMDLWFRELRRHWAELGGKKERDMPWASVKLRQEFQAALETSITPARINERLIEYIAPIKILLNEVASNPESPKWAESPAVAPASVSLLMLDTLLHGIQNAEILQCNIPTWNALKELSTQFGTTELRKFACSYKVWSVSTRMYMLTRRVDGEKAFQEQLVLLSRSKILDGALSVVGEVRPHQVDGFQFEAAREAYQFVVIVGSDLLEVPGLKERAEHYISTANNFLLHKVSRLNPNLIFEANQVKEDLALSDRLRNSIGVFILCPSALSVFTTMERCGIFETLFYHAVLESDLADMPNSFPLLLEALAESLGLMDIDVKEDFIVTLLSMPEKAKTYKQPKLHQLALDTLLQLPEVAMTRKEREGMLDKISSTFGSKNNYNLTEGVDDSPSLLLKDLSMMIKTMRQRNPTSELCTDASQIWNIARACDSQTFDRDMAKIILLNLEALFNAVIRQATIKSTADRKEAFTEKFIEQASSEYSSTSLLSQLATRFLLKSWAYIECEATEITEISKLSNISRFHQQTLNRDIALIGKGTTNEVQQWATFRALSEMPLASIEPDVNDFKAIMRKMSNPNAELVKAVMESGTDPSETMEVVTRQLQNEMISPQDQGILLTAFEDQLRSLRPAKRVSLLDNLLADARKTLGRGSLLLLGLLIKSLSQDDSAVFVGKSSLLVQLCQLLLSSKDITHFGTSLSCLNTILRKKLWLVNQYGIDILLSTLAILTSSRAQALPKQHAPFIYLHLCQTATNIVSLHRKHLGGRMHLLVPLLQNLITCLFKPHRHHGPRSSASLPPWLFNTSNPLTKEHSKAYTRLLSTLCSPTSSSTSSHRRHAELTDTAKQAREYAGQYVPYVLMHYCSLQLGASMDAEVREGLKPGIWEMMGVVGIEGMRGMNVGMGRDERAVWGVVYNEWLRVGRGR